MATFNNNRSNNQWTEVVSKKKQQHFTEGRDPFAGMNTSINYQQEIERLKQLVPKATTITDPKNNKKSHHHSHYHNTISRSNSPDTTHSSSDSDTCSLSDQYVTEQEKLRFLTFVRNWTGEKSTTNNIQEFYSSSDSLWADQSPWNRSIPITPTVIKAQLPPIGMGRR